MTWCSEITTTELFWCRLPIGVVERSRSVTWRVAMPGRRDVSGGTSAAGDDRSSKLYRPPLCPLSRVPRPVTLLSARYAGSGDPLLSLKSADGRDAQATWLLLQELSVRTVNTTNVKAIF